MCVILRQFGATIESSDFIGYWKIDPYVTVMDEDQQETIKVSLWKHREQPKALIVISNLEKKNVSVKMQLSLAAFGWDAIRTVKNRLKDAHCDVLAMESHTLSLSVGAHAIALVGIHGAR